MTFDSRWKNPQGSDPKQLYLWAQEIIKELRKGDYLPTVLSDAEDIAYVNTTSGMTADDVQAAIDEVEDRVDDLEAVTSGLVLLASGTASAQATLDIPLTAYTAYRALKLVLSSFVPVDDDVELWARLSSDGGSNYDAGASDYAWAAMRIRSGTSGASGDVDSADSQIVVAGADAATFSVSNVANEGGANLEVTLFGQAAAKHSIVKSVGGYKAAAGDTVEFSSTGHRVAAQDTDAIRFLFETGNIASGSWAVYGYA